MTDAQSEIMRDADEEEQAARTAKADRQVDEMLGAPLQRTGRGGVDRMLTAVQRPPDDPLARQVDGDHYKSMAIQPVEFIHANGIPFAEGCIIEYVCRHKGKGGKADLEKARHFIDMLIRLEYDA